MNNLGKLGQLDRGTGISGRFNPKTLSPAQYLRGAPTGTKWPDAMGQYTAPDDHQWEGGCYDFDGVDDYVSIPTTAITGTNYTIAFWARPTASGKIVGGLAGVGNTYLAYITDTVVHHKPDNTGLNYAQLSGQSGLLSAWHHYVIRRNGNGNNIDFFLDGVKIPATYSGTLTDTPSTQNVLGKAGFSGFDLVGGMFDYIAYNSTLTDQECVDLYNHIYKSGDVAHYFMDEAGGATAYDSSGNGKHGTIVNATLSTFHGKQSIYNHSNEVGYSAGTNLLSWSEELNNVIWNPLSASISPDVTTDPNGGNTADKLISASGTGIYPRMRRLSILPNGKYTVSVYAKKAEWNYFAISQDGSRVVYFDLNNGTIVSQDVATGSITSVGDGWYRCTYSYNGTITGVTMALALTAGNTPSYGAQTGDGTSGVYLWGAQLETGLVATTYEKTTAFATGGAAIPRNELIPMQDVLGRSLQYQGRVKYDAQLVGSHCGTFDGVDDYILVASSGLGSFDTQNYTIKASGVYGATGNRVIWSYDKNSHTAPYYSQNLRFEVSGSLFVGFNLDGIYVSVSAPHNLLIGDYYEVEAHVESGNQYIKLNGQIIATGSQTGTISYWNQPVWIGKANFVGYYQGQMHEIQFINETTGSTLVHYGFSSGAGTTVYNTSSDNYHGTATNITEVDFWGGTQDVHHPNLTKGYTPMLAQQTYGTAWQSGAYSVETFTGDGYVEMTIREINSTRMLGLSTTPTGVTFSTIQYAIYPTPHGAGDNELQIYESGASRGSFGTYAVGDVLRVARIGTTVVYTQNGNVLRTVTTGVPTGAMHADCSLTWANDADRPTIYRANMNGKLITWTEKVGVTEPKIPALAHGSGNDVFGYPLTHPAGSWHNGAETKIRQHNSPAMLNADETDDYWFDASDVAQSKGYSDIVDDVNDNHRIMSDVSIINKKRRILTFTAPLSGNDLTKTQKYLNH